MSSHSVHQGFWHRVGEAVRDVLPHKHEHQPTGWSRNRNLPPGWQPQHPEPVYEPEQEAWVSMKIRGVLPRVQTIRHTDAITPIPAIRNTDSIPRLALPAPKEERSREVISELDTSKGLPGLPHWVIALRDNPPAVADAPPLRHFEQSDDLLATMRPKSRYQLERPKFADLPTVPTYDGMVKRALDALPPLAPWEPAPSPVAPPAEWLNDQPPSALTELARHNSTTLELPSVTREIAEKHKKESE